MRLIIIIVKKDYNKINSNKWNPGDVECDQSEWIELKGKFEKWKWKKIFD